jgi:hypothetical protein
MDAAMKDAIVDYIKKKSERGKGLNTIRDIAKGCSDYDKREVKKGIQELIAENVLEYWSSGSTTYICLAGFTPGTGETEEDEQ